MHGRNPDLALPIPRAGRPGTVRLVQGLDVQNVGELALSVTRPRTAILERQVLEIDAALWCAQVAGRREVDDAHAAGRIICCGPQHQRKQVLRQNPVREVVGRPLGLGAILGQFEGRRHDACVVDQAVQS